MGEKMAKSSNICLTFALVNMKKRKSFVHLCIFGDFRGGFYRSPITFEVRNDIPKT